MTRYFLSLVALTFALSGCFQIPNAATGDSSSSAKLDGSSSSSVQHTLPNDSMDGPPLSTECESLAMIAENSGGQETAVNAFFNSCWDEIIAESKTNPEWSRCQNVVEDFLRYAVKMHFEGRDNEFDNMNTPPPEMQHVIASQCEEVLPSWMGDGENNQVSSSSFEGQLCYDGDGNEVACPQVCFDPTTGDEVECEPCTEERSTWESSGLAADSTAWETCLEEAACGPEGCLEEVACAAEEQAALAVDSTLTPGTTEADAYYACLEALLVGMSSSAESSSATATAP